MTEQLIDESNEIRERILDAAGALIKSHGVDGATTRAVAERASVQAPTIYRLFGDKRGLLDKVAERELSAYIATKKNRTPHPDPVEDLRLGWDGHVSFGLANPGLFLIMNSNPQSPASMAGLKYLAGRIRAIASVGRLITTEERAASLVHATATGVILTLLANYIETEGLSTTARDAVISAITIESSIVENVGMKVAATTLRSSLSNTAVLTAGEKLLLEELLIRLAAAPPG